MFTATTALPYPHLERATAGLRGQLRLHLLAADVVGVPEWAALSVCGPEEFTDGRGRTWFGYHATIDAPVPEDPDVGAAPAAIGGEN
jgi:hypothetical protein